MAKTQTGLEKDKKKKVLSAEEKAEKKLEKKYKIFRNKILAIIASVIFIACVVGSAIIEASSLRLQTTSELMAILGAATTIGALIMPFLIFRRFTLAIMAVGTAWIDVGVIANSSEALGLGAGAMFIALISMIIGMIIRNKKYRNYNIKLDSNLLAVLVDDAENGDIESTLDLGCYNETLYKAKYYLTAAIITVLCCGAGLLLPFGAWACKYYTGLGILFGDIKEKQGSQKYDEDKPFKNLINKNEFYFAGKTFSSKSPFYNYAGISQFFSFGYILLTSLRVIIKKPTYFDEENTYAGTVAFSTNGIFEIDQEIASAFASYSKQQSEENRQYFIDALHDLEKSYEEWSEREGRRLEAYEQEKWRSARKYATGANIVTDGKDYYVQGTYDGVDGNKKLEGYDQTTGVGYYTDESGKKVEVKNTNIKK